MGGPTIVKWEMMVIARCWILVALALQFNPGGAAVTLPPLSADHNTQGPRGEVPTDHLIDGKKELARSFLKTELRNRDAVNVSPGLQWKLGTIEGTAASSFRSFNQSFILVGRDLYRLKQIQGLNITTEAVGRFEEFMGEVAFIESVEFDGLLLVLAAYKQGFLQLFTVGENNTPILRQTINAYGLPTDAEFFVKDAKLYLVVIASNETAPMVPLVVYRWYGTHLDEENKMMLTAPVAVSSFSYRESTIIVVALQAVGVQKAGLAVLRKSGRKLVMVQYLTAAAPVALQHFVFRSENYLLVRNVVGESIITWWSGNELTIWDSLHGVGDFHAVSVGYVRGETLLLISEKTFIKIYRPTEGTLQLLHALNINLTIQSTVLYVQNEHIYMLALARASKSFVPLVLELHLKFQSLSESLVLNNENPLYTCLSQLKKALFDTDKIISAITTEKRMLLRKDLPGIFTGTLFTEQLNTTISTKIGVVKTQLLPIISPSDLKDKIARAHDQALSMKTSFAEVVSKTSPDTITGKLIADELEIHHASVESVLIEKLNGKSFRPSHLIMSSTIQTITGVISAEKIVVDTLIVKSLNGHKVEDLLKRQGDQYVHGLQQVPYLSTNFINMGMNTINGISSYELVTVKTHETIPVIGVKSFPSVKLEALTVGLLNNVNFTRWIDSLRPRAPIEVDMQVETLTTQPQNLAVEHDLRLVNLTVHEINGVPFNDLLAPLFLKGLNQNITGDIIYRTSPNVRDLFTNEVNGISTVSLLTKSTKQVIQGNLTVETVSITDLHTDSVNGLKISQDAAYVNSPFPIATPVSFQKLDVYELILPRSAEIRGNPIGRRLLHQPRIKHVGKVKIVGDVTLKNFNLENEEFLMNGQNLSLKDLPLLYWTKSSEQVVNVPVVALSGLEAHSVNADTVNGIEPSQLINLRSTKVLQGHWDFESAYISGNLNHGRLASQFPVSPRKLASSVVQTAGTYTIHGRKKFFGGLAINELKANYLDWKKISDVLQQDSSGGRSYHEIHFDGNFTVHSDVLFTNSTLNNINLCDRLSKLVLRDSSGSVPSVSIPVVNVSRISVHSLNGVPVSVWLPPSRGEPLLPRVKKVQIQGNLRVSSLSNVLTINNKDVTPEYFARVVDRSLDGVISGKKTVVGGLEVQGDFSAPHYSGVKLEELELKCLSKTGKQFISYPVTMAEMFAVALDAYYVNDIPMRSLLSSEPMGRQVVEGDVMFSNKVDIKGSLDAANFDGGCDLNLVLQKLHKLDGRHWTSISVNSDLTWNQSLPDRSIGLNYFMKNAVTNGRDNSQQIIVGEIVFNGTVHADNVHSRMDIDDISIEGIAREALRKSASNQIVTGEKIFQKSLVSSAMQVEGNVVAKDVAGVNVQNLNRSLVRVLEDREVHGHKHFLNGFDATMLKIDGLFNGFSTSTIANYDMALLPPIMFEGSLEVQSDLNFDRINDFDLYTLLKERVTLNGDQQIEGHITFEQDLDVDGAFQTPSINKIDLLDIVITKSEEEQVVDGLKRFRKDIHVNGAMVLDNINGADLVPSYRGALFRDEDAIIVGNLVFNGEVILEKGLLLNETVNGMKLEELSALLRAPIIPDVAQVGTLSRAISDTNTLISARGDLSEFLYLEGEVALPLAVPRTRRALSTDLGAGEVRVDLYGWEESWGPGSGRCGLPAGCSCPAQYTVQLSGPAPALAHAILARSNASTRSFRLRTEAGLLVRVFTSSVSYSSRCRLHSEQHLNEFTVIAWMEPNEVMKSHDQFEDVAIYPSSILGYLSDVKLIEANGKVYIVLGLAYSAELDSSEMNSLLVRLDKNRGKAEIIDEFSTKGVGTLDVFYTKHGAHLVVGNSFASKSFTTQAHVDVYHFNDVTEKLQLIRRVPSEGVVATASIVHGDDTLIIIAQDQLYAPVLILKYNAILKDYQFIQQLIPNTVPTGINVFYIGHPGESDAFLGVSTADNLFHLYKYCHAEGFKLETKIEIRGVQGFTSFSIGNKQYLFFSSNEKSSVFEVVKQT